MGIASKMLLLLLAFGIAGGWASEVRASWVDEVRIKAENGDPFAQTTLGVCYELGEGLEKDTGRAFHWYGLAAQKGWAGGLVRLGKCYAGGIGVARDSRKAAALWLEAARIKAAPRSVQETHVQEARAYLARALRLGEGVEQDTGKAIEMATPAAEWGLPEAEYELGLCYLSEGPQKDMDKAVHWLARAGEGGIVEAAASLQRVQAAKARTPEAPASPATPIN